MNFTVFDPSSPNNRALLSNISSENLNGLNVLLESGEVGVDDRDENGATALMAAAQRGKLHFVKALLAKGADVNAEDSDSWTPLLFAAKEGHEPVVSYLLSHGADLHHADMGGWTALVWAAYKGKTDTVKALLAKGASTETHGNYRVTPLAWASGRNQVPVVQELLRCKANVNAADKYGTTSLIWAARKGNLEIVKLLLAANADVNAVGMNGWTALLVASAGNHRDVVKLLLEKRVEELNINSADKDGCTALTAACAGGFHQLAMDLIEAGAEVNSVDRAGMSNLSHAAKAGHHKVVEILVQHNANVNIHARDKRTALYWAVEKFHMGVVLTLLEANAEVNTVTKDGDTPLMKATRNQVPELVSILVDNDADVSAADKAGETCLHVAMRARHAEIIEMLLRDPANSQILYKPNLAGETPYEIDRSSAKPVITQMFSSKLSADSQQDFEQLLGYNVYSSALADMLSDPRLNMPMTVGLFAKWGSGPVSLFRKLKSELKSFSRRWSHATLAWSPLLLTLAIFFSALVGTIVGLGTKDGILGIVSAGFVIALSLTLLIASWFYIQHSKRPSSSSSQCLSRTVGSRFDELILVLQVIFCLPAGRLAHDTMQAYPINFYFTEQTKISSLTHGGDSLVQLLKSLYRCIESDYGMFSTRIFRAFRPRSQDAHSTWKWQKFGCIPYFILWLSGFGGVTASILIIYCGHSEMIKWRASVVKLVFGLLAVAIGCTVLANFYCVVKIMKAVCISHERHLNRTVEKVDPSYSTEGFVYALKSEVKLMTDLVTCLDSFTQRQSRMVVLIDGLDTREQEKVLEMLDAVNILFGDNKAPFIILLAIDPQVIAKGCEIKSLGPDAAGKDYLRNVVNLPFYLQNNARKLKEGRMREIKKQRLSRAAGSMGSAGAGGEATQTTLLLPNNTQHSNGFHPSCDKVEEGFFEETDEEYSSNPKSLNRLVNTVQATGRLLKSFQVDFNWDDLSVWIKLVEEWPYQLSWMLIYIDHLSGVEQDVSLKTIFDAVQTHIPVESGERQAAPPGAGQYGLKGYLKKHESSLILYKIAPIIPFTISLDPQIKQDILLRFPMTNIFGSETKAIGRGSS